LMSLKILVHLADASGRWHLSCKLKSEPKKEDVTMKYARRLWAIGAFVAILVFIPFSPGGGAKAMTLEEAVRFGLRNFPGLAGERSGVLAKAEEVGIATSYHLPKLTLSSRYVKTDSPADVFGLKLNREELSAADFAGIPNSFNNPPSFDTFVSSIELQVPLFVPKALVGRKIAKKGYESSRLAYERKAEEHARKIVDAYVGVLTARGYLKAAESAVRDAEEHLKIAERLNEVGVGIYADVLRASVFLSRAKERLVKAKNGVAVAREALKVAMGTTDEVEVDDSFPLDAELRDLDYYVSLGLENRRDLSAMEKRVEMAKKGVRYEQAGYLPNVAAFGQVEVNGSSSPFDDDADAYRVGVALTWDLFDGLGREKRIKKARYMEKSAEKYLEAMRSYVRFEVKRAYLGVKSARARWEIAKSSLKSAKEGLRLVRGRYENSLARMVELLDAQTALDVARADEVRARNDYYLALADLYTSCGALLQRLGLEKYLEVSR